MQVKTARKYPAPFCRAFENKTGEVNMETITEKTARLRKLRERRDGTSEQIRARKKLRAQIWKAAQFTRQEIALREMARHLIRDIEQRTGHRAPETVQKFIKGE
jgi:hypothetical protein